MSAMHHDSSPDLKIVATKLKEILGVFSPFHFSIFCMSYVLLRMRLW